MRLFTRVLLMLGLSGNLLGVFAQDTPQSGFAIVTLVSGNIAGLIATESLKNASGPDFEQAVVAPSALVTSASILVPVEPEAENTTGLALTNPSSGSGGVDLIFTDESGNVVLNTTVQLGPQGHFARFINEFFDIQSPGFSTPLLLTISSEIPVAILALNFRGGDFASIPLTSLSAPIPGAVQLSTPAPVVPSAVPGFGLGVAPVPVPPSPVTTPVTVPTSPVPTNPSISGTASLIFAQVVTGGGWSTEIAVGNTSAGIQNIRIDFFGPGGVNTGSLTNIVIPSRGVFFFSTSPQAQPVNQ